MDPSLGEPQNESISWGTQKRVHVLEHPKMGPSLGGIITWVHLLGPSFVGVAGTLPPSPAPVGHMGLALSLPQAGLGEGQGINNMG